MTYSSQKSDRQIVASPSKLIDEKQVSKPQVSVEAESTSIHSRSPANVDPLRFSKTKKWLITLVTCFFTILAATSINSYTLGYPSMIKDLQCTESQAVIGLSIFVLGFAITPLFTAALSEELGRQPVYYTTITLFLAMHVMIALAPNIQVVIVARLIQGAAASTGATMVSGTLADIWEANERGPPMAIYSTANWIGNGIGGILGGWIEANPRLQWKWIQWVSLIVGGCYAVVFVFTMTETRASVLYRRNAKRQALKDGVAAVIPKEYEKPDLKQLLKVSSTRPLILLFSEPIVFWISLWLAFAWGVFFCLLGTVPAVFRRLHGFSVGQVGSVSATMLIGAALGYVTTLYQERVYLKKVSVRSVEARLYLCCIAGIAFPISMFMFAWFCNSNIHWILLCLAMTLFHWASFTIYLAAFSYLADCYTTYASSALAGQSLLRNIFGAIFPLFTLKVADKIGFSWANTIWAAIATLLAPIPFVILFFGPQIRGRSVRCIQG